MNATINIICYKQKTLVNGEHPLMIRFCKDGKKKYKSIGISVHPQFWDFQKNTPKRNCPNRELIVKIINEHITKYSEQLLSLKVSNKDFTVNSLIESHNTVGREMKGKVKLDNEGLPVNNNTKIDFNYYFPIIDKIFRLIKEPNYKVLAWVLQYIEAHVLLYTVCPVIAAERPDIPLFTIHDSIVTTEEHAEYVYQRMITIIEETIGFVPKIKPEIWEEGNIELVEEEDTELLEEAFEKEEETKS